MNFDQLTQFFKDQKLKIIIAADGETRTHQYRKGKMVATLSPGGVATAFDALARAAGATYVARGKTDEDRTVVAKNGVITIEQGDDRYKLKRLFLSEDELTNYYFGYANQTLWPLSHAAFEQPLFNKDWYEGYIEVNKKFAKAIKDEIEGETLVWINDYQLALVPLFLGKPKNTTVGFFWHIPWPAWEIFRILPEKKDILWSLLSCDFLAFHRGYQARNFMSCVSHELQARIDQETQSIFFDKNHLTVKSLPIGIDVDVIKSLVKPQEEPTYLEGLIKQVIEKDSVHAEEKEKQGELDTYFQKHKVILGVDRLDYSKGIPHRLQALDRFFEKYPDYREKVVYIGIMSPSRERIPSYKALRGEVEQLGWAINRKYQTDDWQPLLLVNQAYSREDILDLFTKADLCLVTPLDDGMNLVSKEFVIASSFAQNPGMLVLSSFAGSAIDLTASLQVNPYDKDEVADAIARGLEMNEEEKKDRVKHMVDLMEERNIYSWAHEFVRDTIIAGKENREYER